MRLIDADALEQSLTEKGDDYKVSMFATSNDCNIARMVAFECAEEVKNAPTIEAEPVRHEKVLHGMRCEAGSGGMIMWFNTDQAANYVFQNTIERQYFHEFDETNHVCPKCGNELGFYYCEDDVYAVRCMHCEMVTLVKARNPILAVKKVGERRGKEDEAD